MLLGMAAAAFLVINPRSGDEHPTPDELEKAARSRGIDVTFTALPSSRAMCCGDTSMSTSMPPVS